MPLGDPLDGGVELVLDGKTTYLVPSVEVSRELSSTAGGLRTAVQRCDAMDFELILGIVGMAVEIDGHKLNPRQRAEMLPKAIYEAGIAHVAAACISLISRVMNGGKPINQDEDEGGVEGDKGAPLG